MNSWGGRRDLDMGGNWISCDRVDTDLARRRLRKFLPPSRTTNVARVRYAGVARARPYHLIVPLARYDGLLQGV